MARVMFLHGLESTTDADGVPCGRKAAFLADRFAASLPALDTREARRVAAREVGATGTWQHPYADYEAAFATPLSRAREALSDDVRVVVASSFGGAVAMRLVHEAPHWRGSLILLASAGSKLTPYRALPDDLLALVVHGRADTVVPPDDSVALVAASTSARLLLVDDDHRLASVVDDAHLGAWVRAGLSGG